MPGTELALNQVMVQVVDVTQLAGKLHELKAFLSSEELARLERYSVAAPREMFLAARGALRFLLGQLLDTEPARVTIATHEHGKPFLPGNPGLYFNISHSRTLALIALARHPVGVDVEYLPRHVDFAAVMRRFFSESEREEWSRFSVPSQQHAFFRGWTRKEAILKATGEGIAGLGHTLISFKPDEPRALRERLGDPAQSQNWIFGDFCPAPDYQAAIALQAPALQLSVQRFSLRGA
ncbi:MAG TPA: 4'-phosphopantetheinyl transferase superfamily protein [Candidatus Rifleibacterium sp.]|nr:4'-phosphopantetheinyl transferase superfamily protein [Candidatus Rifleibacterium sp.]